MPYGHHASCGCCQSKVLTPLPSGDGNINLHEFSKLVEFLGRVRSQLQHSQTMQQERLAQDIQLFKFMIDPTFLGGTLDSHSLVSPFTATKSPWLQLPGQPLELRSPKLKFWMDQLELEYFDLLSLFEFLAACHWVNSICGSGFGVFSWHVNRLMATARAETNEKLFLCEQHWWFLVGHSKVHFGYGPLFRTCRSW